MPHTIKRLSLLLLASSIVGCGLINKDKSINNDVEEKKALKPAPPVDHKNIFHRKYSVIDNNSAPTKIYALKKTWFEYKENRSYSTTRYRKFKHIDTYYAPIPITIRGNDYSPTKKKKYRYQHFVEIDPPKKYNAISIRCRANCEYLYFTVSQRSYGDLFYDWDGGYPTVNTLGAGSFLTTATKKIAFYKRVKSGYQPIGKDVRIEIRLSGRY